MADHILTLNAGSSSLKAALFRREDLGLVLGGQVEGIGTRPLLGLRAGNGDRLSSAPLDATAGHEDALNGLLEAIAAQAPQTSIVAVGHRVVHGGPVHDRPIRVDDAALAVLARFSPLAPLHQPHNLAGIAAARRAFPEAAQVACFDTAFHRSHPFVDDVFAIPRALHAEGVRRYGFHGLSYEYVSGHLAEVAPHHANGKVVICHLGSGASMCALNRGLSVASTMGFSALDGLPMGTRPGQIDPGVLLYLMTEKGMDAAALSDMLYRQSGLKGLSGLSGDMRDLEASDHPHARQAIDYFVFRVRREIGAMAAVLEGLDAIVFCGGIGENAPLVRERVLAAMEWIGVELDPTRNRAAQPVISSDRSRVRVFIIPTDEERMIARHVRAVLG
jgi:acetate kinase